VRVDVLGRKPHGDRPFLQVVSHPSHPETCSTNDGLASEGNDLLTRELPTRMSLLKDMNKSSNLMSLRTECRGVSAVARSLGITSKE